MPDNLNDFIEEKVAEFINRPLGSRIGHTDWLRSALRECAEKTVDAVCRLPSGTYVQGLSAGAWLGTNNQPHA